MQILACVNVVPASTVYYTKEQMQYLSTAYGRKFQYQKDEEVNSYYWYQFCQGVAYGLGEDKKYLEDMSGTYENKTLKQFQDYLDKCCTIIASKS